MGHDGRVYLVGGQSSNSLVTTVFAYSPAADTWDTTGIPSLPNPRSNLTSATGSDGTIYAIGGYAGPDVIPTAEVDTYKPGSSTS